MYEHPEDRIELESGQVLVLDFDNEGKVKLSTKAYDKLAAGVLSGNVNWQYTNSQS